LTGASGFGAFGVNCGEGLGDGGAGGFIFGAAKMTLADIK